MNGCGAMKMKFSEYLDGRLTGQEMQRIAAHLDRCGACAAAAYWRAAHWPERGQEAAATLSRHVHGPTARDPAGAGGACRQAAAATMQAIRVWRTGELISAQIRNAIGICGRVQVRRTCLLAG